ncbi:unnamed protein product [Rotaria sp. Silwood1]|nr:unnamed protein product [Rotaria sp. Silwood1]
MEVSRDGERTSGGMSRAPGSVKLQENDNIVASRSRGEHSSGPEASLRSSNTSNLPAQIRTRNLYSSEIFGVNETIKEELLFLFEHLRRRLPPMDKQGPMSGKCVPPTRCTERLDNKNQIFGDIVPYNPIRNLQLEECIDRCNNLPQCLKWTWNKNNHDCWLKTIEAYPLNDDNSCISGSCTKFFETLVGKDYVGYDIVPFNPIPNVQTLYDCIFNKCDKTQGCFAYSYKPNTKECYLKGVTKWYCK